MTGSRGFSLVEVIVATAVMLTMTAAVFRLLDDSVARSPLWNDAADLHQRARVAVDALSTELRAAGAGSASGPLVNFFAVIEPRRRTAAGATASALTVRYVPDGGASSVLAGPLPPGPQTVRVAIHSGCRDGTTACGFTAGMDAVVFDGAGRWDTVTVQSISTGTVTVTDRVTARTAAYSPGAEIAQLAETTFYFDPAAHTLRREEPGGGNFPLVDNVVETRFDYFDGARAVIDIGSLGDGPFCGSGATTYDCDVLRIRAVRATVRLQAGLEIFRGRDAQLFRRPGGAIVSARVLPDVTLVLEVAPWNLPR